jgi:hypothetical protein
MDDAIGGKNVDKHRTGVEIQGGTIGTESKADFLGEIGSV